MLRICQESLSSWNGQTKKLEGARIFIHTVTVKQQLYIYIYVYMYIYMARGGLLLRALVKLEALCGAKCLDQIWTSAKAQI